MATVDLGFAAPLPPLAGLERVAAGRRDSRGRALAPASPGGAARGRRRVACLLLTAWPLQVAARARPELPGPPAAVLADGRMIAASASATASGVWAGLAEAEALAGAPTSPRPPRSGRRRGASRGAAAAARRRQPRPSSRTGRASGSSIGRAWPPAEEVGLAAYLGLPLRAELGLEARVGVADGPFVAAVAARVVAGPGRPARVAPGGGAAFLNPRPLRLPAGADARARRRLAGLGVRTFGDLARLPAAELAARLGPTRRGSIAWRAATIPGPSGRAPPRPSARRASPSTSRRWTSTA